MINNYVSADDVRLAIGSAGLAEAEIEVATQAVRLERAQWTVDAIGAELRRREEALTERKAQLTTELHQVSTDLSLIRSLQQPTKPEKKGLRTDELINLYDKQLSYNTVESIMRSQPPFTLGTVPEFDFRGDKRNRVQLWAKNNEKAMEEIYGTRIAKNATKCAHAIDRALGEFNLDENNALNDAVEFREADGKTTLAIHKPEAFLDYLTSHARYHFGFKSMIATMCLAEYQVHYEDGD